MSDKHRTHTEEHILEALAFEFGGEWHSHGHGFYSGGRLSVSRSDSGRWCVEKRGGAPYDVWDVTDCMASALEITAPWVWIGCTCTSEKFFAQVKYDALSQTWNWSVTVYDGPVICELEDSEEDAKHAARAAYLRWRRGAKP